MADWRGLESAEMGGKARFERWRREWEASFYEPLVVPVMRGLLAGLGPEQRSLLEQRGIRLDKIETELNGGYDGKKPKSKA